MWDVFQKSFNYSYLRAFNCLCFSWLRPYKLNKLKFWSIKSYFIEYNTIHKGYRYLNLVKEKKYNIYITSWHFWWTYFSLFSYIIILINFSQPHFCSWFSFYVVISTPKHTNTIWTTNNDTFLDHFASIVHRS